MGTKQKATKRATVLRGGLDTTPVPAGNAKSRLTAEEQRIERLLDVIRTVCSGQWRDELIGNPDTVYPVPGMVMSRCCVLTTGDMVSNNHGETGSRRWHPALTDGLEDMLDRLPIGKAAKYVHPPAIRYDHMTPYREAIVYDPRSIRVDDADDTILRCVRLEPWPFGYHVLSERQTVRCSWPVYQRHKTPEGDWLRGRDGEIVETDTGRRASERDRMLAMPVEMAVNAYRQVTA